MNVDKGPDRDDASATGSFGTARTTLVRVLGELAFPMSEPIATAVLLDVMGDLGFGTAATRRALSRCAQVGLISSVRDGREARWTLTASGTDLLSDGIGRVEELGSDPAPWDGQWLALIVSIPQERRVIRQRLYSALNWAGFGCPVPGIWLTSHIERRDNVAASIERLSLTETTVSFIGVGAGIGLSDATIVTQGWDLDGVARVYADLVDRFAARAAPRTGADAVRVLLELAVELQRLPSLDPHLPDELVPGWSGRHAAEQLLELRAEWMKPARAHWSSLIERHR